MPSMTLRRIGYGAGRTDLPEQANVLRLVLGSVTEADEDEVCMVETNLDDTSGELIGHACSRLWQAGALDVFTTAIQMKKNRPAVLLSILCRAADLTVLERIVFAETGSLGIRRWLAHRHTLSRQSCAVQTAWGEVTGKSAVLADGTTSFAPEYESCRQLAAASGQPLRDIYRAAQQAFGQSADC